MTLREVLHAHIPTLTPQSTLRDAIDKMDIYQFPALVIVDDDRVPVGVITEGDIARAIHGVGGLMKLGPEPAVGFASQKPATAGADMEISDALHQMLSSGITILPVIEDGKLSGVVLRVDLMQAMLMDAASGNP